MLPSNHFGEPARILVVDDDRDTVESMALLLRHFGHDVQTATDGSQAIEIARRQRPTHVLLDLAMPDIDGYEVAARLREESPEPFRLIAITGHGQREDRRRSLAAGFDHHLVKPVDLDDLLSLLSAEDSGTWVKQTRSEADPSSRANEGGAGSASPRHEPGERPMGGEIPRHAGPPPESMRREEPARLQVSRRAEIINALGLHLRAASRLVQLAHQFPADVWVVYDGRKVNGRSMLDMMTLTATCGTWIDLEADGPEAEAALDALASLIGRGFDEADG